MTATERRQIILALLDAYDENYQEIARVLKPLRTRLAGTDWQTEFVTQVNTYQPFIDRGLSRQWFLNEVNRLSQ